ncbi:acyltransferase family protein [Bifidobacterium sp. ESL0790]|uniref:acyltransferase family protein n=1 Tax=Bifidobacterium sp. ESL0790 TaxID=2983233 RepID=UPI0023F84474|nr:acyltransferase family protein [Bifidobacterium sp. ESL0790]WEV71760.1 acyltransferase family protein [Bifidobacterium sp. ESL0790]
MTATTAAPAKSPKPSADKAKASHHVDAIDGLRALAIIGVVGYHARPSLLRGGFLGVTLFFVISGFLITSSVERRFASPCGFGFWRYLWSKIKRIAIPVFALMALVVPATYAFSPGLLPKVHADALPSMLYASNWVYIFRKVPYFAAAGLPSPLTHLWFLAVTMQFYLVWTCLLWLMHRFRLRSKAKTAITFALAVASTAAMVLLYAGGAGVSRVYYGLDTRFSELMIGALLAFMLANRHGDDASDKATKPASGKASDEQSVKVANADADTIAATSVAPVAASSPRSGSLLRALAGLCLVAALVVLYIFCDGTEPLLYRAGYQFVAIMVALALLVALDTNNWCSRILGSRILRYIGSRSFSIYLVHYPLLEFMNPAIRTSKPAWWEVVLQLLVVWAVSEAFYWLAEAARRGLKRRPGPFGEVRLTSKVLAVLGVVATLVVSFIPCDWTAVAQTRSANLRHEFIAVGNAMGVGGAVKKDVLALRRDAVPKPSRNLPPRLVPKAAKVPKNLDASRWTYDAATGTCTADPLIISDSVEMGAQDYVQDHIPAAFQDNLVGRPFSAGLGLYNQHLAEGHGGVLILALGTNGPINSPQEVEDIIKAVGGRPVYFTTVRAPVAWQDGNNAILRSVVAKHKNAGLLDWYTLSNGHSEYFYDDGTHLTPGEGGGREAYGIMVRQGLCGQ